MKTEKYQRKPFLVDCVQVTEENLEAVAKWCKGELHSTDPAIAEKFQKPIQTWIEIEVDHTINDRQKKAFVGDWVLWANRGFKIYTPKAFERTFERVYQPHKNPDGGLVHVDRSNGVSIPKPAAPANRATAIDLPRDASL